MVDRNLNGEWGSKEEEETPRAMDIIDEQLRHDQLQENRDTEGDLEPPIRLEPIATTDQFDLEALEMLFDDDDLFEIELMEGEEIEVDLPFLLDEEEPNYLDLSEEEEERQQSSEQQAVQQTHEEPEMAVMERPDVIPDNQVLEEARAEPVMEQPPEDLDQNPDDQEPVGEIQEQEVDQIDQEREVDQIDQEREVDQIDQEREVDQIDQEREVDQIDQEREVDQIDQEREVDQIDQEREVDQIDQEREVDQIDQEREVDQIDQEREVDQIDQEREVDQIDQEREVDQIDQEREVDQIDQEREVDQIDQEREVEGSITKSPRPPGQ